MSDAQASVKAVRTKYILFKPMDGDDRITYCASLGLVYEFCSRTKQDARCFSSQDCFWKVHKAKRANVPAKRCRSGITR